MSDFVKDKQYYKFSLYGFLKNLRFFDAFFILFLLEKDLSYTQIGTLYAIREIFINIFEIPSGVLADTYGRKKSLIASLFAYIVSFFIFYISSGFYTFLLAFILYGVGDAFRTGTHKGMIMDYLKLKGWEKQKILYYGHTRSWSQIGSAISSLIAGLIVFYSGVYSSVFIYSIVPYLLNLILIISYPRELDKTSLIDKKDFGFIKSIKALAITLKRPNVLNIVNTSALHTAYLRAIKDYIQPLMVKVAMIIPVFFDDSIEKKNGLIVGFLFFLLYFITSKASKMASKLEHLKGYNIVFVTLVTGFGFGVFAGVFYYFGIWILSLILFVGIYIIENIRKPILTGYIADNVPNDSLVSVISAQSLLKTIIASVLALSIGVLTDCYGLGIALVVLSIVLLAASFLFTIIPNAHYQTK